MCAKKENFLLYHNMGPMFRELPDEQAGQVIKAIFDYSENSIIVEFPKGSGQSFLLKSVINSIDINNQKYEERCSNNRKHALTRWKKIFYENNTFTKESFEKYCKDNGLVESFDEILIKQKDYVDTDQIDKLKEDYNCNLVSNETILRAFS